MDGKTSTASQGDFIASPTKLNQYKNKPEICNLKYSRESEKNPLISCFHSGLLVWSWMTPHTTQCNVKWQKLTLRNPKKEINLTFAFRTGPRLVILGHSHRITGLSLEEIFGGHLVQSPLLKWDHPRIWLSRTTSRWILNTSKEWGLHIISMPDLVCSFLMFDATPQFVPVISFSVTGHH